MKKTNVTHQLFRLVTSISSFLCIYNKRIILGCLTERRGQTVARRVDNACGKTVGKSLKALI